MSTRIKKKSIDESEKDSARRKKSID